MSKEILESLLEWLEAYRASNTTWEDISSDESDKLERLLGLLRDKIHP